MTGLDLKSVLYSGKAGNEAGKIRNLKNRLKIGSSTDKKVSSTDFSGLLALKKGSKEATLNESKIWKSRVSPTVAPESKVTIEPSVAV